MPDLVTPIINQKLTLLRSLGMCRFESEGFGMVSSLMSAFPNPERGGERDRDLKKICFSRKFLYDIYEDLKRHCQCHVGVFENGVCFQKEIFQ